MNFQIFFKLASSWLGAIIPSTICLFIASLFVETGGGWPPMSFSDEILFCLVLYMTPSFIIVLTGLGTCYKLQTKVNSNSLLEYLIAIFISTIAVLFIASLYFGPMMLLLTPVLIIPPTFSAIIFWLLMKRTIA